MHLDLSNQTLTIIIASAIVFGHIVFAYVRAAGSYNESFLKTFKRLIKHPFTY